MPHGLPFGLTKECVEAVKAIKFVPATLDGRPVTVRQQLEFDLATH